MTGVEAVSNGVGAFREPRGKTAQKTLTVIILLLIVLLAGIAGLIRAFGITATPPGEPGYQSTLSLLTLAVSGRNWYYYLLHNQRAAALKGLLYFKGDRRSVVANVPWYLDNEDRELC